MPRDHAIHSRSEDFSRNAEDRLDWAENRTRPADDCRHVDDAFIGGSFAVTVLWLLLSFGLAGGAITVAAVAYFGRH